MPELQICVLSDSELKEFDSSQYLDEYEWDIFIPQKPVHKYIRALDEGEITMFTSIYAMELITRRRIMME